MIRRAFLRLAGLGAAAGIAPSTARALAQGAEPLREAGLLR
jgi:hypothetical protein